MRMEFPRKLVLGWNSSKDFLVGETGETVCVWGRKLKQIRPGLWQPTDVPLKLRPYGALAVQDGEEIIIVTTVYQARKIMQWLLGSGSLPIQRAFIQQSFKELDLPFWWSYESDLRLLELYGKQRPIGEETLPGGRSTDDQEPSPDHVIWVKKRRKRDESVIELGFGNAPIPYEIISSKLYEQFRLYLYDGSILELESLKESPLFPVSANQTELLKMIRRVVGW